jgi:hypothetical protein
MRMVCSLIAASLAETYVTNGIYLGNWGPERLALRGSELTSAISSALIWTAAFWVGQTRYGNEE